MSLSLSIPESSAERTEVTPFRIATLSPQSREFEKWMARRQDFVRQQGWLERESDWDDYDDNPETQQLALYDKHGDLLYGMRLTPVDGYGQSLSWEMVADTAIGEQVKNLHIAELDGPVWDLTRLIPGENPGRHTSREAIPRLFGEGLRLCWRMGDSDPVWIFALDSRMKRWLETEGVTIQTLGEAVINDDKHPTTFGAIRPAELARAVVPNDFTFRAMGEHRHGNMD